MNDKLILDACCGGRMFWFNKKRSDTIYIDNRVREEGHVSACPKHAIKPDIIMDFRELKFPDKFFKLVVFDPPHLIGKSEACRMLKKYGNLSRETWRLDIKKGFDECWRVLEDYGILIFKWNESSIKKSEILEVIGKEPLFGHPTNSHNSTHWFCFMKIPELNCKDINDKTE